MRFAAPIFLPTSTCAGSSANAARHPQAAGTFSLNENFRSTAALVAATNALFAERADEGNPRTFMFRRH